MTVSFVLMVGGLLLSVFGAIASRERRLAQGKRWYPSPPIMLVCFWGCAGVLVSIHQTRALIPHLSDTQRVGTYIVCGLMLLTLPCFVGYWMMKKWGVWAYTTVFVCMQLLFLLSGQWEPSIALVGPILFIYAGFVNFPEMT